MIGQRRAEVSQLGDLVADYTTHLPNSRFPREAIPQQHQGQIAGQLARRRCLNRAGLKSNGSRRAKVGIGNSDSPKGCSGSEAPLLEEAVLGAGEAEVFA
jgi:hypothetical protein